MAKKATFSGRPTTTPITFGAAPTARAPVDVVEDDDVRDDDDALEVGDEAEAPAVVAVEPVADFESAAEDGDDVVLVRVAKTLGRADLRDAYPVGSVIAEVRLAPGFTLNGLVQHVNERYCTTQKPSGD